MEITPVIQDDIGRAKTTEDATQLPWELTVAQWALESDWGEHCPGNNCFGIKCYPGQSGTQVLKTTEYIDGVPHSFSLPFATFPTLTDAFIKHAELITKGVPYGSVWRAWWADRNRTPESLAKAIAPIYATDPRYADQIIKIMGEVSAAIAKEQAVSA